MACPKRNLRSHPNVVKLYGYCLEPPTVCLILELLPLSLKDVLYPPAESADPSAGAPPSSSSAAAQLGASAGASTANSTTPDAAVTVFPSASEGFTQFDSMTSDTMLEVSQPADNKAVVTPEDMSQQYITATSAAMASASRVQLPRLRSRQGGHDSSTPSKAWQSSSTFNGAYDKVTESQEGKQAECDPKGGQQEQLPAEATKRSCANTKQQPQQQQAPRPSLLRVLQIATDVASGLEHLHSRPLMAKAQNLILAAVSEAGNGQGSTEALTPLVTVEEDQAELATAPMPLPYTAAGVATTAALGIQTVHGGSGESSRFIERAGPVSSGGGAPGSRIVHRG
jgi:hypothetical protein